MRCDGTEGKIDDDNHPTIHIHPRTGDCVIGNLEYGELFERDRGLEGFRGSCCCRVVVVVSVV